MDKKIVSAKTQRQRRFLLFVPLVALPFIAMLFWVLGGGQQAAAQKTKGKDRQGLDLLLPDAAADNKGTDKMSSYQQADKDSARLADLLRNDPYKQDTALLSGSADTGISAAYQAQSLNGYGSTDEQAINEKMALLYKQIHDAQQGYDPSVAQTPAASYQPGAVAAAMAAGQTDPDMQQLSGMLDKILYIEHPEMAREKIKEQSVKNSRQAFIVSAEPEDKTIQLMEPSKPISRPLPRAHTSRHHLVSREQLASNAFYEYSDLAGKPAEDGNAIRAAVAQTRSLVSGATLKLKLLTDIYIKGVLIPKNAFVYGTCSISGDRLLVSITSIHSGSSLFPVALTLYDVDGIAGIYMPDALSRKVSKSSADQAIQGIDLYGFDNSLTGQAASVGVQAAKGLFSKKAALIKVTVREGYQVLLKNTNENNH